MTLITVNQGTEADLDLILAVGYTLRLFKNDVTSGLDDTAIAALTEASFQEADFPGYASVAIAGGAWTTTPGNPGVATYTQQAFIRSSSGAVQNIYGYYYTVTATGALRRFKRFPPVGGVEMTLINDEIRVTPRITLTGRDSS